MLTSGVKRSQSVAVNDRRIFHSVVFFILSRDGQVTWFLGADNDFPHPAKDSAGHRPAPATLMTNGHARPSESQKTLGTARRSLVRWRRQLDAQGAGSGRLNLSVLTFG